jgi:NAD(P)-dependent dehydrogenase (short-subunit alcohol dehydrogenase family)
MSDQRVVLITGASSGVGQASAHLLAQHGYRVFGTSRNVNAPDDGSGITMIPLDVRSDDSARACVNSVAAQAGRIDILVNNAGFEMAGALEEHSMDEAKAQFETNFFGVVRMVKAVLPLMRADRRGQIINVSSLSGLAPIPFMGFYSASKFALDGFTETLRLELRPFNIHVSQIEPGFLKTTMMSHRQTTMERIPDYDPWRQRASDATRDQEEKSPGPELVAEAILEIVSSRKPRLRYLAGSQAKKVTYLRRFLPEAAFEQGVRSTFRLDK